MRQTDPSLRATEGPGKRREPRRVLPWLLSIGLHALVLAWWASLPEPPPRERAVELELRPIELVELPEAVVVPRPEPTPEVAPVLEPPRVPAGAPGRSGEPSESKKPSESSEPTEPSEPSEPTEPSESSEPSEPTEAEGGVALLGLRGGSRSSSSPTSLRPALPPPPAIGQGRVVRKVGAASAAGEVERDGSPRSLSEAGFRARRNGKHVFRDKAGRFKATLKPDGRVVFHDMPVALGRDPVTGVPKMGMPGLAEGLRAASGQELYLQEKRRLLEDTFELRLELAVSFAQDKVERRLKSLYRELLTQWQDDDSSEVARRRALFQRWDECEEGLSVALPGFKGETSSEIDQLRHTAGAQARETIERFIRTQLPAGSPQAYPAEELRRLNASRRSQARFEPYR